MGATPDPRMIVVVDYGMGNLGSVLNILKKIGAPAMLSADPEAIATADRIILPGVGAFAAGMENLQARRLVEPLTERAHAGTPILGCCLGMQLMTQASEEGNVAGLGWLPARTVRFAPPAAGGPERVPHMGWNHAETVGEQPLFRGAASDARYYFVHSYHVVCDDPSISAARTQYGYEFDSAIARDNLVGVQFHPEKSHRFGMQLLRNFVAGTTR